jgi:hypothetical protein
LLVCVFTQAPLHKAPPPGQAQVPLLQLWPVAQALAHAPQLAVSV